MYLAYAIAEDGFSNKILHLYDIYLIINKENIDWDYLIKQTTKRKTIKPLLCVLLQLEQNFSLVYDYPIIKELAKLLGGPNIIKFLTSQMDIIFFEDKRARDISKEHISRYCNDFGFWDTFKFACKILFSHRWYIYKYGIKDRKGLFLYYRIQAIKEVINGYLKPFIKYVLLGKGTNLKNKNEEKSSKDFLDWLKYN